MQDLSQLRLSNATGWVREPRDVHPLLRAPVTDIILGSLCVEDRPGNPEPNFWVADDESMGLNSRGLPGKGLVHQEAIREHVTALVRDAGKRLTVSIVSTTDHSNWVELAKRWMHFADTLELCISCPNKWRDGKNETVLAEDPVAVRRVIESVANTVALAYSPVHIAVKLPPYKRPHDNETLVRVIEHIVDSGAVQEVVNCNTAGGHTPPVVNGKPVISMPVAGMSGPKLRPWSVAQMRVINGLLPCHIRRTGVGGIVDYKSAREHVDAGATGLQVGTHFFKRFPRCHIFGEILQGFAEAEAVA